MKTIKHKFGSYGSARKYVKGKKENITLFRCQEIERADMK